MLNKIHSNYFISEFYIFYTLIVDSSYYFRFFLSVNLSVRMAACPEAEVADVDLIARVIASVKPTFADSDIDQETLEKLQQLWIKKLKLQDDRREERGAEEEGAGLDTFQITHSGNAGSGHGSDPCC